MHRATQNKNSGDDDSWFTADTGQGFFSFQNPGGEERNDDHHRDQIDSYPFGYENDHGNEEDQDKEYLVWGQSKHKCPPVKLTSGDDSALRHVLREGKEGG